MRKKRFLSIEVSILFILQIFMSFIPLTKVNAENTPLHFAAQNTSTCQVINNQRTKTDEEETPLFANATPEKMETVNDTENTTTSETPENSTETNSEIETQQGETIPQETDTQQSNSESSDSSESQPQNKTAADPEPATPTVVNFPFLTEAELTDINGKDISSETDVDKSLDVIINYTFSIPEGQTISPGTSYSIQLTDQIKVKDTQADTELKNSDGTVIGSISADQASNNINITFPNEVKGAVSGKFSVSAQFNESKIGNSNPVSVNIGSGSVDVNFKQEEAEQQNSAEKPGEAVQTQPEGQAAGTNVVIDSQATGPKDITDLFSFITGVSIKDANGNDLGNDVDKNSEIHANYTWSIPSSADVNSGDYYKMQLPSQIHIAAPIDQPINDQNGTKVADMHVDTSGLVTLTFTDYPSTHSNVSGYFYIDCHFEESKIGSNNPVTITFAIPGISDPVKVDVNFEQPKPSITKDVVNGGYNPATDEITWQITVNKENVNVNSASVEDTIADGQVFVPGSVTINGASAADNYDATNKKLTVDLGDITTQQVITFKTSVHDDLAAKGQGSYDYSNKAILNYDDNGTPGNITSNTKTVNVPVKLISKTGHYDEANKKIDWTITVNESGRTIDNAVVTDTIPEGLTLIDGSVKVDGTADSNYTMSEQKTFTYNLGSITEKKTITFSTSVDQSVYNSNGSPAYTNTAVLTGDGVTDGTSASVGVGVSTNIIQKSGSGYDAATGIITWTITVNSNKTNVAAGAVVTDTIPVGQQYVAGSAKLDGAQIGDGGYTAADSGDSAKTGTFVYTFNIAFSDTHTITFQTQVTDPVHYKANYTGTYKNSVNLKTDVIDESDTGTQQVNSNVITKTGAGYDYSTRQITWKIVVNNNAMPITNAVVTDIIPEGQKYVAGSASIDDGTNGSFTTLSDNQVVYTFTGTISKTYNITFKTELTDLSIFNTSGDKTLNNTASITGNEIPTDGDASSTGKQTVKNSVVTKESTYTNGNSYIDWTVKANANWSIPLAGTTITSATITDKLQDGLSLDTDTVELYKATVNADGSLTPGDKVALTADNVKYNPDTREFDFTFPQDAGTGAFILNFRTNVTKTGNYTNSVEFNGSGVDQSSTTTQNGIWFSQGGGGATGETGSITVIKVGNDGVTPLQGAVFQLLDQYGNVKETSAPTGTDGAALFDKLKYDTNYSVKEVKAPTGYNLSSEIYTFQVSNAADKKDITYNFEDSRKIGNVTFTKTGEDSDINGLQGAEFTLYKEDGTTSTGITSTSDANGVVTFTNVPYGYKIKETTAPIGYTISSQILTAGVDDTGSIVLDNSSIADTKIRGNVSFTKTGEDSDANGLQGALFTLYKNDGTTPVTDGSGSNITATSGSDGKVTFNCDVPYGYKIIETTAPIGYTLSSQTLTAILDSNGKIVLDNSSIADTKIRGDVSFTKTGEDSDINGLSGAVFTLCKSDGTPTTTTVTSNESGAVTFTNVPYGYKIKETTAPIGYTISSQTLTAILDSNGNIVLDNSSIADTKIRGNVTFTKEDGSGKPLQGAEFTLYKDDGTTMVGTATSGSDGKVTFDNAAYGYKIKESKPPSGYYSSSKVLTAKMNDSNNGIVLDETEFKNTKIVYTQGVVSIKKIDENGNPLKGAEFTLFDSTQTPVQSITTGDDGIAQFNNIQFGSYTVKETKAPNGYSISTSILSVNVSEPKTYDLGTISDESTLGTIEISKSDFSTQEPVAGATITIYKDAALTDVVASKVTDTNGKAIFKSLPYGHYYFKETNAPEGYKLNEDVHQFDITEDNSSVKDSITDEKIADNTKISIDLTANPNSIVGDGKSTSTLTAKVVDSEGKPISGVKVDFSAPSGSFPNGNSAVTNENGEASVIYTSDKITGTESKAIPVTASVNDPEHNLNAIDKINVTFEPSSIQGTVWDNETGKAIGGATVVVKNDSIGFQVTVTTSDDGKYKVAIPEGDLTYDVLITVPVVIDGKQVDKTFIQHSNVGTITGNVEDVFSSEKTATGIVLIKNPDGNTSNYFDDYSKLSIEGIKNGTEFSTPIGSDGDSKGIFHIEDLEQGKDYVFNVVYDLGNGEKIIVGTIEVKTSDGDMKITTTLIDPYGVVTDSSTGKPIEGVDLKLYYADTEHNKTSGKTPGTLVQLPTLNDFPPRSNANPQSSDEYGNYAYMVFPNTDYYIVATKPGYNTVTTGTISVKDAIVKHDISMNPTDISGTGIGGGGGSTNIKGTIIVKKADEKGNPLKEAVFTLYNSNGNEVQTSTTNTNGIAEFTKIQPGKYTVKESKAPEGYNISTKTILVEINMSKIYDIGTVQDTKESEVIQGGSESKPEPTPEQKEPTPEQNPVNNNTAPDNNQLEQTVQNSDKNNSIPVSQSSQSKGDSKQTDTSKISSSLPKTGSFMDTITLIGLGTMLILVGCVLLLIRKKLDKTN